MWWRKVTSGALGLLAGGVLAGMVPVGARAQAELFQPPEGCLAYLTVQHRSCRVEHHYTCADTGQDRWRVVYTGDGPIYLSRIDSEAQWIASRVLPGGGDTETLFPARDPASMTTLLETGEDDFDFEQRRPDGRVERVVGSDRITGPEVVIDGEALLPTAFDVTFYDRAGGIIGTYSGNEFVSATHRRFFAGRGTSNFGGVETSFDRSPREFIYPGAPGFLSVDPVYDCGMMMSRLEVRG